MLTKYVVRGMMAEGRGRIVNLSSIIASTGYNALSVYGATKAAMVGFTKSLSREVGRVGITVNAIAPGFIDTAMTRGLGHDQRKRVADRSALRRLAEVEDIAKMSGVPDRRDGPQHHRRSNDGGRRQHGVTATCVRDSRSSLAERRPRASAPSNYSDSALRTDAGHAANSTP